nr:MAG TPA_asm: Subtilisin Savinase [Caudoviricetes sp.]
MVNLKAHREAPGTICPSPCRDVGAFFRDECETAYGVRVFTATATVVYLYRASVMQIVYNL